MNAMPVLGCSAARSLLQASSPPAEVPSPTMAKPARPSEGPLVAEPPLLDRGGVTLAWRGCFPGIRCDVLRNSTRFGTRPEVVVTLSPGQNSTGDSYAMALWRNLSISQ